MVNRELRRYLSVQVEELGVPSIDLMGDVPDKLEAVLGIQPLGEPGRYRQLKRSYFEWVEAIENALAHDDGRDPVGKQRTIRLCRESIRLLSSSDSILSG